MREATLRAPSKQTSKDLAVFSTLGSIKRRANARRVTLPFTKIHLRVWLLSLNDSKPS